MRNCKKCGADKSADEFHKDSTRRDGLHPYCKTCVSAQLAVLNTHLSNIPVLSAAILAQNNTTL